jgi:hypothetical protein
MAVPVAASNTVPALMVSCGWNRFTFIGALVAKWGAPPATAARASESFFWANAITLNTNNTQLRAINREVTVMRHPPERVELAG